MTTQTSGSGGASAPSHSTRVSFCEGGKVSFQFSLQMINSLSCFDNTNNFINPPPQKKIYKLKVNNNTKQTLKKITTAKNLL